MEFGDLEMMCCVYMHCIGPPIGQHIVRGVFVFRVITILREPQKSLSIHAPQHPILLQMFACSICSVMQV
jgi:hypothetical protein